MQLDMKQNYRLKDLLFPGKEIKFSPIQVSDAQNATSGIPVSLPPLSAFIFEIQ
jgi:hypothetical protein